MLCDCGRCSGAAGAAGHRPRAVGVPLGCVRDPGAGGRVEWARTHWCCAGRCATPLASPWPQGRHCPTVTQPIGRHADTLACWQADVSCTILRRAAPRVGGTSAKRVEWARRSGNPSRTPPDRALRWAAKPRRCRTGPARAELPDQQRPVLLLTPAALSRPALHAMQPPPAGSRGDRQAQNLVRFEIQRRRMAFLRCRGRWAERAPMGWAERRG